MSEEDNADLRLRKIGYELGLVDKERYQKTQERLDSFKSAWRQIEIEVKYIGFIERQLAGVGKFKNLEKIKLPEDLNYGSISGLSCEIKEKLNRFKPMLRSFHKSRAH